MQTEKTEILLFFSYARADAEFALKLAMDLRAAGTSLWMDQLDIIPGKRWDLAVEEALETCPCLLVILTPTSVESNNVMDEVSFALEQNRKVVPVRYGDCDIPFRLRRLQHIDFTHDYDAALAKLVRALKTYSEEVEPHSAPADDASSSMPSPPQRVEEAAPGAARQPRAAVDPGSREGPSIRLTPKHLLVAAVGVVVLAGVLIAMWGDRRQEGQRPAVEAGPAPDQGGGTAPPDPSSSAATASTTTADIKSQKLQETVETAQLLSTPVTSSMDNAPPATREEARTEDPGDVKSLNREGYQLFRAGRLDEAIDKLTRAVSLQPDHLLANLNLAKTLCAAGRLAEAAEVMEKAIRLNPRLAPTARGDGEFTRGCKPILRTIEE